MKRLIKQCTIKGEKLQILMDVLKDKANDENIILFNAKKNIDKQIINFIKKEYNFNIDNKRDGIPKQQMKTIIQDISMAMSKTANNPTAKQIVRGQIANIILKDIQNLNISDDNKPKNIDIDNNENQDNISNDQNNTGTSENEEIYNAIPDSIFKSALIDFFETENADKLKDVVFWAANLDEVAESSSIHVFNYKNIMDSLSEYLLSSFKNNEDNLAKLDKNFIKNYCDSAIKNFNNFYNNCMDYYKKQCKEKLDASEDVIVNLENRVDTKLKQLIQDNNISFDTNISLDYFNKAKDCIDSIVDSEMSDSTNEDNEETNSDNEFNNETDNQEKEKNNETDNNDKSDNTIKPKLVTFESHYTNTAKAKAAIKELIEKLQNEGYNITDNVNNSGNQLEEEDTVALKRLIKKRIIKAENVRRDRIQDIIDNPKNLKSYASLGNISENVKNILNEKFGEHNYTIAGAYLLRDDQTVYYIAKYNNEYYKVNSNSPELLDNEGLSKDTLLDIIHDDLIAYYDMETGAKFPEEDITNNDNNESTDTNKPVPTDNDTDNDKPVPTSNNKGNYTGNGNDGEADNTHMIYKLNLPIHDKHVMKIFNDWRNQYHNIFNFTKQEA